MNRERGNISLVLLVIGLFLVAVAQLAMLYVKNTVDLEQEHWRSRQLRLLCGSAINRLAQEKLEAGEQSVLEATLQPGNIPVILKRKVDYSEDGLFCSLVVRAEAEELNHCLRQVSFQLDEEKLQQANQFMLISRKELLGGEFLADGGIYTSAEEVTIPQIEFLKNSGDIKRSISAISMADVKQYGLDNRFHYLSNASTPLTFSKNLKVYGTAVIATAGSIIIEEGCKFFDRMIFISKGNITIKDGVDLPQALLIAYGKVSIGTGCKIGGVIFSDSNIELLGTSQLTYDRSVVAPYLSAFYIL